MLGSPVLVALVGSRELLPVLVVVLLRASFSLTLLGVLRLPGCSSDGCGPLFEFVSVLVVGALSLILVCVL